MAAKAQDQDLRVYRDAPRIWLNQQRLRLLERERERRSARWEAFAALIEGGAQMPEPGFANALYFRVTRQDSAGRRAVDWALGDATDLRQLALVFDWCGPVFRAGEADRLAAKIQQGLAGGGADLARQNARVLAAIAIADKLPDNGEAVLREVVRGWWPRDVIAKLEAGQPAIPREHLYALMEMFHALRDNTRVDLRETAIDYFQSLPLEFLAAHYPAPLPAAENEYRIPVYVGDREPDLKAATLSRAAGLALVAYDTNAVNHQYVQGWLMNDRFMMRSPLGIVYEFLWANPYQPGLSYRTLPPVFHDPTSGNMFARTNWEDDATWLGYFEGRLQLFQNGQIQTLRQGAAIAPFRIGAAAVTGVPSADTARVRVETEKLFVLGLTPRSEYGVEIDDQELSLLHTDSGGTLVISVPEGVEAGVRLRKR
jgi:hypothetical protein